MKKLLIAALSLFTFCAYAQKLDNALLWKISGNGLSKPSYLYGTMHITCDNALDKNTLKAFDETSQLYLELDMDEPGMQMKLTGGMMMKNGTTLKSLATPEDYAIVDEFIKKNVGMGIEMMNSFKPSVVSMLVIPKMLDCPMQSIEDALMEVSKEQKEEIYGLETVEEQIAVFDAIPYDEQMKELVKTAKEGLEKGKATFKRMMELYNTRNLNGLMDFIHEEDNKFFGENSDELLDKRNRNWIPKIEAIAKKTPTLFGVGAAHLGGENGVIMLLRKKGYKVEAVK